jgi:tetratricopeptide (TPR) repeat protein
MSYFSGRRRSRPSDSGQDVPGSSLADLLREAEIAYEAGNVDLADQICDRILSLDPQFSPALVLKGFVSASKNKPELAISFLERALVQDDQLWPPRIALTAMLMSQLRWREAANHAEKAVAVKPEDVGARNNLGLCYLELEMLADAAAQFERIGTIDGPRPEYRGRLDQIANEIGPLEEAPASTAEGLFWLGRKLNERGNVALAEMHLRNSLELDPDAPNVLATLGLLLQQVGRFEEGAVILERAMDLKPEWATLYAIYVNGKKITKEDMPLVERMEALLPHPFEDPQDVVRLHKALGKCYDELAEYPTAIHHFDEAHALVERQRENSGSAFNPDAYAAAVDRIIDTFDESYFEGLTEWGSDSETPVFIIGLMRSGTTLTEQILSSHPKVAGAGELIFWFDRMADFRNSHFKIPPSETIREWSTAYLDGLRQFWPDAERIIDKHPENYFALGLIRTCFPNARFVHCRRNPLDTAISIYTTSNLVGPKWFDKRENIVFAYRQYRRLMDHWERILPMDRLFTVDYEDLTSDPEPIIRKLIDFCGLKWDDACLRSHDLQGVIRTPSLWQARQPIYKTSQERWKRYEPWLGALKELESL